MAMLFVVHASAITTAATIPYEVVLLESLNQNVIIQIDADTGNTTTIGGFERQAGHVVGVSSDQFIYTLTGGSIPTEGLVQRLDPRTMQLEVIGVLGGPPEPTDLDITSDGRFFVADQLSGILEAFPEAGGIRQAVPPLSSSELGVDQIRYGRLAIDSADGIVFSALLERGQKGTRDLFRYRPGQSGAERISADVSINDFVLESDVSLIAIGQYRFDEADRERKLYQVDLQSGASTVLFEGDALAGAYRLSIDPMGRPVALVGPHGDRPAQVVRIDVASSSTTVLKTLDPSNGFPADMDILIVPEPPCLVLLVLGSLAAAAYRRSSR